ncbi:MAG: hypothetical protein R2681_03005 [Pyrinomonadaceae bacterium]
MKSSETLFLKLIWMLVIVPIAVGTAFGFIYLSKYMSPNRNDVKLRELEWLSKNEVPKYPGSIKVGEQSSSKDSSAGIFSKFRGSIEYKSIIKFYRHELSKYGWKEANVEDNGTTFIFRRGDKSIQIDLSRDRIDWDYGISVVWERY